MLTGFAGEAAALEVAHHGIEGRWPEAGALSAHARRRVVLEVTLAHARGGLT